MKKQVYVCDKCKTQIPDNNKPFLFSLFHESKRDAAGDSEEYHYQSDLCNNCLVSLADRMMKFIDKNVTDEIFKSDLVKQFNAVSK